MGWFGAQWVGLQQFLETGGPILLWIMALTFVMWAFMVERFVYWRFAHKAVEDEALDEWGKIKRADVADPDWRARAIHAERERLISQVRRKAHQNVELIKTLVAIAPLLGLMGTVTGMVQVFDVMAISGSSNARAMSEGVSRATIPTMAGMVSALSGLFFSTLLERWAKRSTQQLADHLELD